MRPQDQADRGRQDKRISLLVAWCFHRFQDKKWSPRRGRLRNDVDSDERHGPFHRVSPKLGVDPAVQGARHGDGEIDRAEGEPQCRFGYVPDDRDDGANQVHRLRHGDGPDWTEKEVGRKADKQREDDAQPGRDGRDRIESAGRVSVQALQPQQKCPRRDLQTGIPEKTVEHDESPDLPVAVCFLEVGPSEILAGSVTVTFQSGFGHLEIMVIQHNSVRFVRRAGKDEVAQ